MDAMGSNIKKEIRVERTEVKEPKRVVKREWKLKPDDRLPIESRSYEQHGIRSSPSQYPNGWMVSFNITCPDDSIFLSLPMPLDDAKPTIGEAHDVGFAMARAIISGSPPEKLNDFTESEREEIHRFCLRLNVQQETSKSREERKDPIPRSRKSLDHVPLSEKQLRTLFRIAISAFGGFGHELVHTLLSLRALTAGVTLHAGSVDSGSHVANWIARVPPILDRVESMIRMGMEYRGSPWPDGDPFITRPAQVFDEMRRGSQEITLHVAKNSVQSLDLIYPNPALFTIFHQLIGNATRDSRKPTQARVAWHIDYDRFICEIDDDGPGLCDQLSGGYVDRRTLDVELPAGLLTVEQTIKDSQGSLVFRRSTELGGTQVKFELPLVGYWLDDQLHMWKTVYETPDGYLPIREDTA